MAMQPERKCEHRLAINVQWTGSDMHGNLDRMTCYCTVCGKSFDCTEIRTERSYDKKA